MEGKATRNIRYINLLYDCYRFYTFNYEFNWIYGRFIFISKCALIYERLHNVQNYVRYYVQIIETNVVINNWNWQQGNCFEFLFITWKIIEKNLISANVNFLRKKLFIINIYIKRVILKYDNVVIYLITINWIFFKWACRMLLIMNKIL